YRNDRSPGRQLRIGYVSPDFLNHPVGRFLQPLFEHHDRDRYEIVCYSDVHNDDWMTKKLREYASAWRSTVALSDAALAEQIYADGVDILVDLSLHTARNRLLTFARKPAPVQVTYLAYPGTSGMEAMDYRFTDAYLDPPGNERFYTERSIRLKTYWCYRAPKETPDVKPLPAERNGYVTFGCMAQFNRTSAAAREAWAQILR